MGTNLWCICVDISKEEGPIWPVVEERREGEE